MTFSRAFSFWLSFFIIGIFVSSFVSLPSMIILEIIFLGSAYFLIPLFFLIKNPRHEKKLKKTLIVFGVCLIMFGSAFLRQTAFEASRTTASYTIENKKSNASIGVLQKSLYAFKGKAENIIRQNFLPPESSVLLAVLIGNKKAASKEWNERLNRSGLRHITAVSGMHIVIISGAVSALFLGWGASRAAAFYLSIIFLWLFVAMVGFPASAVRAGIMASFVLLSQRIGRPGSGKRALLLAGFAMLFLNPALLKESVGFQLSFLSAAGIIYLAPLLKEQLERIYFLKLAGIASAVSVCFSAYAFSAPCLILSFNSLSLVSPLSGLVVTPALGPLMVLGIVFLLTGIASSTAAFFCAFLLKPFLSYIVSTAYLFSKAPFLKIGRMLSFYVAGVYCLFLFLLILFLRRKKEALIFKEKNFIRADRKN